MNTNEALARARDLERAGFLDQAEAAYRAVLAALPGDVDALHLLGILAHRRGRTGEAIDLLEKASKRAPRNAVIHNNLGQLLKAAGRLDDAERRFRRAVAFRPDFADAHSNLGTTLSSLNRGEEALACFRRALAAEPGHALATYNLATLLLKNDRHDEAIPLLRAVAADGAYPADAQNNLGYALFETGDPEQAETCFRAALELDPAHADALVNMGRICAVRHETALAEDCFRRALAVRPGHARALANLGTLLQRAGRSEEALAAVRDAYAADPAMDENASTLAMLYLSTCSWNDYAPLIAELDTRTRAAVAAGGRPAEFPFLNICRVADPEYNYRVASLKSEALARRLAPRRLSAVPRAERKGRARIVLGYLSADFRNHPVGQLIRPLFGQHDRTRFEVRAYSAGPDDGSDLRKRFAADADAFVDIRALGDRPAAERIRADGVDILIELGGFTQGNRLGVSALRPAPIAILHAGYPGTTGSDFVDYLIADRIVVPPHDTRFYSEKLIVVPGCHAPQESGPVSEKTFCRKDEGLPDKAFVFCSFNEARKLTPQVFEGWLRLLKAVPESVLWLIRSNDLMVENLRREAASYGIEPSRLVFAAYRPKAEHLARLSLADLALDTTPFNGAVTTGDLLWAGVPVVTTRGAHFASRYSESKMAAAGLPRTLVARDLDEYQSIARRLASNPAELSNLRRHLAEARGTAPLFDIPSATRVLEAGYTEAFNLFVAGKPPRHIVLDDAVKGLYGDEA
ncbi:MAG: tetratricopeptide repeat protein [Rhodospirillales bacterium]|nr:tetratricopeptide repeat protein [Rhodospirillales bacterium]